MIQSPIPEGCEAIVKDGSVVFEKEKQEFKRGDVIVSKKNEILLVDVHSFEDIMLRSFVHIRQDGALCGYSYSLWNSEYLWRLATEDEKQKLFDKMKEQGLKWNVEKKRVETIRWRAEKGENGKPYIKLYASCTDGRLTATPGTVLVQFENDTWQIFGKEAYQRATNG